LKALFETKKPGDEPEKMPIVQPEPAPSAADAAPQETKPADPSTAAE